MENPSLQDQPADCSLRRPTVPSAAHLYRRSEHRLGRMLSSRFRFEPRAARQTSRIEARRPIIQVCEAAESSVSLLAERGQTIGRKYIILSAAKNLACWQIRFFAALRMT